MIYNNIYILYIILYLYIKLPIKKTQNTQKPKIPKSQELDSQVIH